MVAVPAATPVTTPDAVTVATPVLLLVHVPPAVASVSGVVNPTQTDNVPVIAGGKGLTVTTTVGAIQPVGNVYVMVAVPAALPVAVVVLLGPSMTETLPLLLAHVPPAVTELRLVVKPWHTVSMPVIADGFGLTVRTAVVKQPLLFCV